MARNLLISVLGISGTEGIDNLRIFRRPNRNAPGGDLVSSIDENGEMGAVKYGERGKRVGVRLL